MFFRRKKEEHSLPEEELIARYRQTRDGRLLGEIFSRYTHLVFGVCMKHLKNAEESKDAVMDIFGELGEKLCNHEVTYFKSWLFMVARNHCLMQLRKAKNIRNHDVEAVLYEQPLVEFPVFMHPNEKEETEARLTDLESAIEKLAPDQAVCIRKFYLEEKSYREVSEETGWNLKKVKSCLQNGKRNLKIILNARDG